MPPAVQPQQYGGVPEPATADAGVPSYAAAPAQPAAYDAPQPETFSEAPAVKEDPAASAPGMHCRTNAGTLNDNLCGTL